MSLFKKEVMINNNFYSEVQYESDGYTDCENSGCDEGGICRCYTIDSADVTEVYLNSITSRVIRELAPTGQSKKRNDKLNLIFPNDSILEEYGIYRLCVIHQLWNPNHYKVDITGGYYGDEIGDIILAKDIFKKWSEDCIEFWSLDDMKERLFFLLEKEYGGVLPNLLELTPKLITINYNEIDWKSVNPKHVENIQKSYYPHYEKYQLPRGIVRKMGTKYQLVDGYHRILTHKESKFEVYSFE